MNKSKLSVFKKIPTVTTPRLVMRKMLPSDDEDMFEYAKNPAVTRYLLWEEHVSRKFTHSYLKFIQSQYAAGNFYDWALTLAESGKMIGTCGFSSFDTDNNAAEVGYVLSPDHWRKGIATEALLRVMRFGFEELELHRIYARIMDGNTASEAVARKCGMKHEATFRKALLVKGEYRTIKIYAVLREEFQKLSFSFETES
ncbi:MAG: GNAT family N-acetyltransferase [Clostridia bacterium]|nr:GNAT family N-acetyltransferase [Clostridia bacterium]